MEELQDFYEYGDILDLLDRLEATDVDLDTFPFDEYMSLSKLHKLVIRREREKGLR